MTVTTPRPVNAGGTRFRPRGEPVNPFACRPGFEYPADVDPETRADVLRFVAIETLRSLTQSDPDLRYIREVADQTLDSLNLDSDAYDILDTALDQAIESAGRAVARAWLDSTGYAAINTFARLREARADVVE